MTASALLVALAVQATANPSAPARDVPVAYNRQVGQWHVVGDRALGACILSLEAPGRTQLRVAATGQQAELVFSLKNNAWKSLPDDKEGRLWAHFSTGRTLTDSWNLSVVSYNSDERGPVLNFTIDRAKNDGASFIEQFSAADSVSFFREKVPVATFDLQGSSQGIGLLVGCRAYLRADPSFDPFAE